MLCRATLPAMKSSLAIFLLAITAGALAQDLVGRRLPGRALQAELAGRERAARAAEAKA